MWLGFGIVVALAGCGRIAFDVPGDAPVSTQDAFVTTLVAHYAMDDDPSGGAIADTSGNARDGTCMNCPTSVPGHIGSGFMFDGVTTRFTVPDTGAFHLTEGYTVALWLNPATVNGLFTAISKPLATGNGASCELALFVNMCFYCTTSSAEQCLATPVLAENTWTHVALTWDGATKRAYFNGALAVELAEPSITYDTTPLVIGSDRENGAFDNPYNGILDDVRIYDRALSAADIAALAQ